MHESASDRLSICGALVASGLRLDYNTRFQGPFSRGTFHGKVSAIHKDPQRLFPFCDKALTFVGNPVIQPMIWVHTGFDTAFQF